MSSQEGVVVAVVGGGCAGGAPDQSALSGGSRESPLRARLLLIGLGELSFGRDKKIVCPYVWF